MTEHDFARLMYLSLLGAAVGGWFIMENRNSMGKTLQQAAIWGLIFIGVIAVVGLWEDIRSTVAPRQSIADEVITLPLQVDGHYYLTTQVNGVTVEFLVDTGATNIVLTQNDAKRVGINLDDLVFTGQSQTANGTVATARVWLDSVVVGDIVDQGVRASVNSGDMDQSLLGMAYLNRYTKIEIADQALILTR